MTAVDSPTDSSLLQQYSRNASQEAFTELVARHTDWVYSAAVRQVRDPHLAEDITQAVFLILCEKAARLDGAMLHRWLFRVTRYASANAVRGRARREWHERQAAMAKSEIAPLATESVWEELAPGLDEMIDRLRISERDVLLLRFYQKKSMAQVGAALGISEAAAKERVARAIEKLRSIFRRRGVAIPGSLLSGVMMDHAVCAAPASLASRCAGGAVSTGAASIAHGAKAMLIAAKFQIAAIIAGILLVPAGIGAWLSVSASNPTTPPASNPPIASTPATAAMTETPANSSSDTGVMPFVNSHTGFILAVDISAIDPEPVGTKLLNSAVLNPTALQKNLLRLGNWMKGFRQAGGSQFYAVLTFPWSQVNSGTIIVPLHPGSNVDALRNLIGPGGAAEGTTATIHGALITGDQMKDIQKLPSEPRPDLIDALAASDDPIRFVYVPTAFNGQKLPPVLAMAGVFNDLYPEPQWKNVKWCLLAIVPTADESASITYQCKDHDSAAALATLLASKANSTVPFFQLLSSSQPQVDADRVVIPLDPRSVNAIVLAPLIFRQ